MRAPPAGVAEVHPAAGVREQPAHVAEEAAGQVHLFERVRAVVVEHGCHHGRGGCDVHYAGRRLGLGREQALDHHARWRRRR